MHCLRRSLLIVSVLALIVGGAGATTMIHLETPDLCRHADEIVIGRVESVRSYWNDSHTQIFTDASVRITNTLKGTNHDVLVVTQVGGEIDGVRVTVPGCAAFRPGEEALLFVNRGRAARSRLVGMAQGKFEIEYDARGEGFVQRRAAGFEVRDMRRLNRALPGSGPSRLALQDLLLEIRSELAREPR